MKAASLAMLTALIVSVPINLIFSNGYTGNMWGNGVIDYLLDRNCPPFICSVIGQLAIEFADKMLTMAAVYIIILFERDRSENDKNNGASVKKALQALPLSCACLWVFHLHVLPPLRQDPRQK